MIGLRRPAAVLFDMDGLLLDTERTARDSMMEVVTAMGFPMSHAIFAELIGLPVDTEREQLATIFGSGFDYDTMRELRRARDAAVLGPAPPLRAGARAIVECVAQRQIPAAVATSSRREKTLSHLHHTGLLPMLAAVVARDDVPRGKPSPDLYLAAAAALGAEPATCLALEDSYNGVRAAHAAGVPVIMVPDLLPPTDEMHRLCVAIVPGLATVADWLAAL